VGGLFLIWLGVTTFAKPPAAQPAQSERSESRSLAGAYASTLLLTLTNPMTIFAFAAILSGAGLLQEEGGAWSGLLLVTGVFLGSAVWWLLLSGGVSLFRHRVTPAVLVWVNRCAGLLLVGFGVAALWTTLV
jgi:threonine/homoserine/homoserine lactone efflux protein